MKIAILGTGSIGSLFAACLAQDPANEILCIVATEAHRDRINRDGITISEADGTEIRAEHLRALTGTEGESPADLVIVTVKSYSTRQAVHGHPELFGPDTLVLTVQNGYGNHDDIRGAVPDDHIFLGTTSHGMNIDADGIIHHAGSGPTYLGPLVPEADGAAENAAAICEVLQQAGFETFVSEDINDAIYRKLLINIAINPLSALNDTTNEYVLRDAAVYHNARMLVREAIQILDMAGYHYDFDEMWEVIAGVAERTGKNVCSMLADVRNGRPTEIRRINGAIVEMAGEMHVDAPQNRDIVHQIELQFGAE